MIKLNLPPGFAQMDEACKQMSLEIALGQAIEEVQKSVVQLAGQVVSLTEEVRANKVQNGKDLAELAGRIESNKPRVQVSTEIPVKLETANLLQTFLKWLPKRK